MGGMKISELDFVRLLPAFMRDDEAAIALSKAVNQLMGEPGKRLSTLRTWDKIDELNEAECDEMAWELDIDWYDSTGMGLEEKRETIKLAQQIKRKRGTKWAVERLISAYLHEGYVMEWYEMDESPYTFMVLTTNPNITGENFDKFMEAAKAAKNERSHIVGVFYYWEQGPEPGVEYGLGSSLHRYDFEKCGTRHRTATVGFVVKPGIETEPEETGYLYGFHDTDTCGTYPRVGTVGAAMKQRVEAKPEGAAYPYKFNDTDTCGTYPKAGTVGAALKHGVAGELEAAHTVYVFPKCGENLKHYADNTAVVGQAVAGRAIVTSQ